jgi:hypothetical protein
MTSDDTLKDYDAVYWRFKSAKGPEASAEVPELLFLGHKAIEQMRGDTTLPSRTLTLFRQRTVTIGVAVDQSDERRESFLLNSAHEDNDHNPFESWVIVSCDIVFKGQPVTKGSSTSQKVIGVVTERRTVTLEDDKEPPR